MSLAGGALRAAHTSRHGSALCYCENAHARSGSSRTGRSIARAAPATWTCSATAVPSTPPSERHGGRASVGRVVGALEAPAWVGGKYGIGAMGAVGDSTLGLLMEAHVSVHRQLAHRSGYTCNELRTYARRLRGLLPRRLVRQLQWLDIACAIARHIPQAFQGEFEVAFSAHMADDYYVEVARGDAEPTSVDKSFGERDLRLG